MQLLEENKSRRLCTSSLPCPQNPARRETGREVVFPGTEPVKILRMLFNGVVSLGDLGNLFFG
jgi:hypothetical protein